MRSKAAHELAVGDLVTLVNKLGSEPYQLGIIMAIEPVRNNNRFGSHDVPSRFATVRWNMGDGCGGVQMHSHFLNTLRRLT